MRRPSASRVTLPQIASGEWVDDEATWFGGGRLFLELQEAVGVGLFTRQQAKAIRDEGERVIERAEAWTEPFNQGWEEWRPNPDWPLPSVPEGWDRL